MKKKNAVLAIAAAFLVVFALLSSELVFQHVGAAATSLVFGITDVGKSTYMFGSDKDASRFLVTENGTMQSISVYFANSWFYAKAAIYSDANGKPSQLIAQSNSELIDSSGWHAFALPQNSLVSGCYWFAVVCSSSEASGKVSTTSQNQHCIKAASYDNEYGNQFGAPIFLDSMAVSIYGTLAPSPAVQQLNYGIYWDQACTNATSKINWGPLEAGTTKSLTVYVRNEGNVPFVLTKSLSKWNPSNAAAHITLAWDYMNATVTSSGLVKVTLTLSVSLGAQTISTFSFDTAITATEIS